MSNKKAKGSGRASHCSMLGSLWNPVDFGSAENGKENYAFSIWQHLMSAGDFAFDRFPYGIYDHSSPRVRGTLLFFRFSRFSTSFFLSRNSLII